ncbi:cupin domain-containing protein [Streptomyces erythrochromogenes]|uniref:cupin domain-containing protein n=1 Tax=Streptomyces erythrochromogenes TaxID=285574 RepID=UPI0036803DE3
MSAIHRVLAVVAATAVLTTSGAAASQAAVTRKTPAPTVREIAQGGQQDPVDVAVDGPTQVNFREITIPRGGSTGRHCHYGQLIGVVKSGSLTHRAPVYPDGVHVYNAGDSLVEGAGYVHEGRNEGTEDVVLWVTYVTPQGRPLAETDLSKCQSL